MDNELKTALDNLAKDIEGKNKLESKALIDAFKTEFKTAIDAQIAEEVKNGSNELSETLKAEFKTQIDAVQAHADKLDLRLQEKAKKDAPYKDEVKALIVDNFETIKTVRKGHAVSLCL